MNRKALAWLYEQLPDLVTKGVVPAETAERIRAFYGPLPEGMGRRILFIVFGLTGTLLVGLGIVMILGHNWDQLSRLTRLLISLGLLATAQVAAGLVLWRRADSEAWREGTAVFLTLAVGTSIALVGQTYHLVDDFKNFLLIWMLLSVPLVYLMDVKGVAGMYLAGVMVWLVPVQPGGMTKQAAWVLLALILPYCWRLFKTNRYANAAVILAWLLVLSFYACFSLTWDKHLWEILYASLFSATFFTGLLWFGDTDKAWQKPFQAVGLLGGLGMAYYLSSGPWGGRVYHYGLYPLGRGEYLMGFGLFALAAGLAVLLARRGLARFVPLGALPAVVAVGYLLQDANNSGLLITILMNIYLLGISVLVILQGVREVRLGVLNSGMLMLVALILFRFFDYSYSFIARGIAFTLIGLAFLAVNMMMARRKNGVME